MEKAMDERILFSFKDIKNHPDTIIKLLSDGDDVSLLIRRRGNDVYVISKRTYSDKVNKILKNAKTKLKEKEKRGFTKEQAFKNFENAQEKISKYLK